MKVLVTGAYGFIGTALVERLTAAGHEVRALTSRAGFAAEAGAAAGHEVFVGDVRDAEAMRRAVRGVDGVCHLAALVRVREARERAREYWGVNHGGAVTVARAAAEESARSGRPMRFVLASTGAVYGRPALQPIPEDLPLRSTNDYGETKLAAEQDVAALVGGDGDGDGDGGGNGNDSNDSNDSNDKGNAAFGAVALRLFNVAGAVGGRGGDPDTIIPKTLAVARGDLPFLRINGDGSAVRDFVHVRDVARAFELSLGHAVPGRRAVFNVGATGARVLDVVRTVREVTGRDVPVEHQPSRGEAPMLLADTRRIRADLGWVPEHSDLRTIVADAWSAMGAD